MWWQPGGKFGLNFQLLDVFFLMIVLSVFPAVAFLFRFWVLTVFPLVRFCGISESHLNHIIQAFNNGRIIFLCARTKFYILYWEGKDEDGINMNSLKPCRRVCFRVWQGASVHVFFAPVWPRKHWGRCSPLEEHFCQLGGSTIWLQSSHGLHRPWCCRKRWPGHVGRSRIHTCIGWTTCRQGLIEIHATFAVVKP